MKQVNKLFISHIPLSFEYLVGNEFNHAMTVHISIHVEYHILSVSNFFKHLQCAKHFTYINSFNPHASSVRQVLLLFPYFR